MSIREENRLVDPEGLYAGIDAGSVSLNCIVINEEKQILYEAPYERHFGKVEEGVLDLIYSLYNRFGEERIRSVSFTGNHGKNLSERLGAFYEFETISQVLGAICVRPDVRTIISMGGQDTALFQVNHLSTGDLSGQGAWELAYFNSNGPCASGTGSFIDQQAQRLATSIYSKEADISRDQIDRILVDFIRLGIKSKRPANVACRCTVFTKSDMIHLQNRGERLEDIIYGLHVGNARNYMSTIVSNRALEEPILFVGGLSLNELQVKAFQAYFPGLIVPSHSTSIGALGVALEALDLVKEGRKPEIGRVDVGLLKGAPSSRRDALPVAPMLVLKETAFPEDNEIERRPLRKKSTCYLGIDIGSTTTKYALINKAGEIIHKSYVPTKGRPIEVTQGLLKFLCDEVGKSVEISGTATTGSGRNVVGDFLNADLIIDEITAHARGAVEIDREVDTIFEIGGQDSKYIYISNTYPLDFDMNKVCAAGTGSFLHELANKYGINIVGEFQEIALSSETPVRLAERCTVFMESDLVFYHQKGVGRRDLIAGLCYAIVFNYLNRVVEKRKIGQRVMFLGGPSLNKGVVAAFENVLGRPVLVPKHREVLGAYGAAISVKEMMRLEKRDESTFRGLGSAINDRMEFKEKTCSADLHCHNQCKLKIYDFDGRRSVWGGECGRYELTRSKGGKKENLFALRQEIWQTYMAGVYDELEGEPLMEVDKRPTVGMQRALYGHQNAVLWAHFFDRLGFRLVLTPPTNTHISKVGIETMAGETCYPVKVSHGHIKELLGKTTYLFIPSLINMPTPEPAEKGSFCPLIQANSYMVRMALGLDPSSILNPVIHLKYDTDTLTLELADQLKSKLGVSEGQIRKALYYALERQDQFRRALHKKGEEILEYHNPDDPLVVVTGRPYNLYDDRLNLRLGQSLAKIGVYALPMDFIDVSSVDLSDFPSMYWGLGAQILRTAKFVESHPTYFGLHLTNFGCGADSFLEHFYRHIMGNKPYLILELDEHSAVAGVMTRLEAYRNVIENSMQKLQTGLVPHLRVAN
ncbi:MAG: CoA activase [Desulfobacterales bacterium]|nr:CoA activase [Desulfobacterales bacterium]MBL7101282.1 CoA activase [Desulfobacteraceae bacterium]MBL7173540.1 CoA activase [Desulfobacteraceae bacterium]